MQMEMVSGTTLKGKAPPGISALQVLTPTKMDWTMHTKDQETISSLMTMMEMEILIT